MVSLLRWWVFLGTLGLEVVLFLWNAEAPETPPSKVGQGGEVQSAAQADPERKSRLGRCLTPWSG